MEQDSEDGLPLIAPIWRITGVNAANVQEVVPPHCPLSLAKVVVATWLIVPAVAVRSARIDAPPATRLITTEVVPVTPQETLVIVMEVGASSTVNIKSSAATGAESLKIMCKAPAATAFPPEPFKSPAVAIVGMFALADITYASAPTP